MEYCLWGGLFHARRVGVCEIPVGQEHGRSGHINTARLASATSSDLNRRAVRALTCKSRGCSGCRLHFPEARISMKIYGDTNSGNCLKVKWVCDRLRAALYAGSPSTRMKGETRTPEFLKLNSAGQVPAVELDDGRTLAQSNAIIRYLARGSDLIPAGCLCGRRRWTSGCSGSNTATSPISRSAASRWSIWASLPPISIPTRSSAAMRRWRGWSISSPRRRFWPATPSRSPTSRCLPIRASRMKAAFTSTAMPPCAAGSARPRSALGLPPAR